MSEHGHASQAHRVRFLTPGTLVLITTMIVGYGFGLVRLIAGIGPVTNLDDQYPWGIWIGIDVASGVALAAGGFTVAALVNIFGRKRYEALERPALLTAWLGYSFVGAGLLFDLGRYYNIWHPAIYWQGNSVLFEVGMCVMFYLTVLTVEFAPALLAGLTRQIELGTWWLRPLRGMLGLLARLRLVVRRILPIFIIAGVVLSFMHQSSLGSLMLIAPTKVSPLWWTPILPLLFLLSAIMVGFPVVILESIAAGKAFGKEPEMHLLAPLSKIIPFTLGVYATLKFGDLFYRNDLSVFTRDAGQTIAWLFEIGIGLVIPFILLLQRAVRHSPRWLFISVSMIIAGVVMNRINVFLVAYEPPYATHSYFPAVGEIALTAALICTIIFLYRFFATYFPVLPGREPDATELAIRRETATGQVGLWGWIARAVAVLLLLGFIDIYAYVHKQAVEQSKQAFREVARRSHGKLPQPPKLTGPLSFSSASLPGLLNIEHPLNNARTNDYEPARFSHKSHAVLVDGDCTACHHRVQRPKVKGDRIGIKVDKSRLAQLKPTSCVACHQHAGESDAPNRPGLKAAYHRQCVGCHEKGGSRDAPTACTGACHARRAPDHAKLVKLDAAVGAKAVTQSCLSCHEKQGRDFLQTVHWTWGGLMADGAIAKSTTGAAMPGKRDLPNGFCIHTAGNMGRCSQCHAGYGWTDKKFDHRDPRNIDCLVCHATGKYAKSPTGGGLPTKDTNLLAAAKSVGRPTRATCGRCHFNGGGGANVKHGDLEPGLASPKAEMDVHMGRAQLRCQSCHRMQRHRIAGRSSALTSSEGRVRCQSCHAARPHRLDRLLGKHLDAHTRSLSCQACHIPRFAKQSPTKMSWDWSQAGKDQPAKKDALGMPTFSKKKGAFVWAKNVRPTYLWSNGEVRRHRLADKLDAKGATVLAMPVGSKADRTARIAPYKPFDAVQPYDLQHRTLVVPKLYQGFWTHFDWQRAATDGMKAAGQPYSGKLGFAKTRMYWAINHEVVPAKQALSCADCHSERAVECKRCHQTLTEKQYHPTDKGPCKQCHGRSAIKQMDFAALGYPSDPALSGGRFRTFPLPPLRVKAPPKDAKAKAPKAAAPAAPASQPANVMPDQYQDGLF